MKCRLKRFACPYGSSLALNIASFIWRTVLGQSEEKCLRNQRMPDVQLADGEDLGDGGNVVYGQSVSGVDDQAQIAGEMRAVLDALELPDLFGVALCVGICAGVQLDNGRADIIGGLDLPVVGIDKQGHAYARVGQDFGEPGNFSCCANTSKPPSVVISCRFSGTMHTSSGITLSAFSSISSVNAISRFRRVRMAF